MTCVGLRGASLAASPRRLALLLSIMAAMFGAFIAAEGTYLSLKAATAQVLLDRAWKESQRTRQDVRPWPWADVTPVLRLEAPRLRESVVVLGGVSGEAMAFGPGLMLDGPQPGARGMAVIAAHRDSHFRFLKEIREGDTISITDRQGARVLFTIMETRIVDALDSGLTFQADQPMIALVTCYPFDAVRRGPKRFVAIGEIMEIVD